MNGWENAVPLPVFLLAVAVGTAIRAVCARRSDMPSRVVAALLEAGIIASTLLFLILQPFVGQSYHILSSSMRPTLWENDRLFINKWVYRTQFPAPGEIVVFRPPSALSNEPPYIKRVIGVPGDIVEIHPGFIEVGERNGSPLVPSPVRFGMAEIRAILGDVPSVSETGREHLPLRLLPNGILWDGQFLPAAEFAARTRRPGTPVHIYPSILRRNGHIIAEAYLREEVEYHVSPFRVPPMHLFVLGDNRNGSQDSHIWGVLPQDNLIGRADFVFYPRMKSLTNGE